VPRTYCVNGADTAPLVGEVRARGNGEDFTTLERWLGDILFRARESCCPQAGRRFSKSRIPVSKL